MTLPPGIGITEGPSFVPTCEPCQWIGRDYWTKGDAIRAAKAHSRSNLHRDNAPRVQPTSFPIPEPPEDMPTCEEILAQNEILAYILGNEERRRRGADNRRLNGRELA